MSTLNTERLTRKLELQRQLKIIEVEEKQEEADAWEAWKKLVSTHINALLNLVPKHRNNRCSDSKRSYNDCDCLRCFLLCIKLNGYWPDDEYNIQISLVRRTQD